MRNVALLLTLFALVGCNRGIDSKEAVRQGIVDYLSSRSNLNMASMNVDVTSVVFRKNEADAMVSFSPKGANPAGQGMSIGYTLERKGNRWVVKGRADSGKSPHRGAMPSPTAANPHGEAGVEAPAAGAMPPGHPDVSAPAMRNSGKK